MLLSHTLVILGHRHPALAISDPVVPAIDDFQVNINDAVRPYPVLNTAQFVTATTKTITDRPCAGWVAVGGIDQLTHADDALINFMRWPEQLTQTYRRLLHSVRHQPTE
ncbi:MAG: hypothetical protein ACRDST_02705 [Pseudonocardiaceae bacterium]